MTIKSVTRHCQNSQAEEGRGASKSLPVENHCVRRNRVKRESSLGEKRPRIVIWLCPVFLHLLNQGQNLENKACHSRASLMGFLRNFKCCTMFLK